jgi:hypothetical protein
MGVPFAYSRSWQELYNMNPSDTQDVGYCFGLTLINGTALGTDISVVTTYNNTTAPTNKYAAAGITVVDSRPFVACVGFLTEWHWLGESNTPHHFSMHISDENSEKVWGALAVPKPDNIVLVMRVWVGAFSQKTQSWYEKFHQTGNNGAALFTMNGQISKGGDGKPDVQLDQVGESYKGSPTYHSLSFKLVSGQNYKADMTNAVSPLTKAVQPWGGVTGTPLVAVPADS